MVLYPARCLVLACSQKRRRRYLTIEEEEEEAGGDLFDQEQRQRCSNRAATATPWNKKESHPSTKPGTAAAAYTNGEYQGFGPNPTKNEASTPARARGKGGKITTPSSSSRRAVTAPTKPREVVVGRDYSLGRQTPSPPVTAAPGAPGAPGKTAREPTKAAGTGRGGFRGNKAIVVQTRGGGEAVVVVPKRPRPIWFAGSGAIQAEWSALPGGARVVRDLEGLEEQGRQVRPETRVRTLSCDRVFFLLLTKGTMRRCLGSSSKPSISNTSSRWCCYAPCRAFRLQSCRGGGRGGFVWSLVVGRSLLGGLRLIDRTIFWKPSSF